MDLKELRRLSETVMSDWTALVKQAGTFIHFTNHVGEVRPNPSAMYSSTPLGVYCYPVKDRILNSFYAGHLEFSDAKYVAVIRPTVSNLLRASEYSYSRFKKDHRKLVSLFGQAKVDAGELGVKDIIEYDPQVAPGRMLIALVNELTGSSGKAAEQTAVYRGLGYSGLYDDNFSGLISFQKGQAVFFDGAYTVLGKFETSKVRKAEQ